MYICKETYYKELAHTIMEADKSPDLQSASWPPRRANGVVAVRLGRKAWEPGELTGCVTARLRASRLYTLQEAVFQFKSEGRLNWCHSWKAGGISPLLRGRAVFFVLFRPSTHRRKSTDMKGNLHALMYCLSIQMLIASRYTFTDTPQMFDQIFGHYVAQSR